MPTTQVAKLLNRQGNLTDLPLLDPGELGYAKDVKRLFIGNDPISVNSNGSASYTVGIDLSKSSRYRVTTQPTGGTESELASTGFAIGGTTLTLTTAPAVGTIIRVYYNTEIQTDEILGSNTKETLTLTASGTNADTGILWDADDYNCATIEYSLLPSVNTFKLLRILIPRRTLPVEATKSPTLTSKPSIFLTSINFLEV